MGHLDPFFQELNGIGILALIVTVIAVIVRMVFCRTMKERLLIAVTGLISAVITSLGADYALRPFAGVGSSATGGSAFTELFIGFIVTVVAGTLWWGIAFSYGEKTSSPNNQLTLDPDTELKGFAPRYRLVAAMSNEDSYYGWFMIDHDNGGSPDPLYEASLNANLQQERQLGKLYGDPGSGLDYSAFGNTAVQAGQQGESALARIIAYMQLNVISFWSLYGLNENRQPINADIDCVLVGIDPQQQVHAWFVDAKNYKGGSDTKYVNLDPRNLVRISISRRALIKGSDGTPVVKMSENMATQRDNWASTLETYHVAAQWMVCMVPGGHNGNPDVSEAVWPGNVRVVTPGQLVAEIQSLSLLPVDNIPPRVVRLFTSAVKQQAPASAAPVTSTVPMPVTSPVPAPIPQPAITNNCPECGQPLDGQTNFCPNCGTPLNA
jgi:hypothetical protein